MHTTGTQWSAGLVQCHMHNNVQIQQEGLVKMCDLATSTLACNAGKTLGHRSKHLKKHARNSPRAFKDLGWTRVCTAWMGFLCPPSLSMGLGSTTVGCCLTACQRQNTYHIISNRSTVHEGNQRFRCTCLVLRSCKGHSLRHLWYQSDLINVNTSNEDHRQYPI